MCMAVMSSCSSEEKEPKPANELNSSTGVNVELEWTTGGTTSDATSNTDLDLFLMKGTTTAGSSTYSTRFESVTLSPLYADGEYVVKVTTYYTGAKTTYTLYVKSNEEGDMISYTGEFLQGDTDLSIDFLKIKKAGNKYTVTEF